MIPRRDTLFAALVDDDRLHPDARLAAASDASGVDFTAAREHLVSARVTARVTSDRLVSAPAPLAVIDYTGVTDSNLDGAARLVATRAGQCHGFAVWFDAELAPGIGFSNAPGSAELLYGRIFFPFSEAVELSEGSDVMLGLTAKRIAADYLWRWTTTLETQGGTRSFNQSSLGAEPILSSRLRQSSDAAVPAAWKELELDRAILALVDGSRPTREIAERVAEIAGGYDIALDRVVSLVERLGVKR
jgi:protein arginine N-methyltransferase 1